MNKIWKVYRLTHTWCEPFFFSVIVEEIQKERETNSEVERHISLVLVALLCAHSFHLCNTIYYYYYYMMNFSALAILSNFLIVVCFFFFLHCIQLMLRVFFSVSSELLCILCGIHTTNRLIPPQFFKSDFWFKQRSDFFH